MHWASARGILNIVIRLCEKGASTAITNKTGATVSGASAEQALGGPARPSSF